MVSKAFVHRSIGAAFLFGPGEAPAIDLIVSVQTSLLDSDPTLNFRSVVPTREVLNVQ